MSNSTPHLSHPKYRPDIDGLRAVAVLAVVFFHAFPEWIQGGFIGVDVFFVISGFLISTIIFENLDRGTFSFTEFYARRIRRIFPALILVLVACFAFGWFVLLADEYKQLGKYIAAGAGFVSNIALWNDAGYFDASAETKPLLHLWSLGIEEQFYIVFPVFVWITWKRKFNLFAMVALITLLSFVLNVRGIDQDAVATFYSPLTRFWELLSGSLLAWFALYGKGVFQSEKIKGSSWTPALINRATKAAKSSRINNLLSAAASILLLYGFWQINRNLEFPGWWALIPVISSILFITAGQKAWINRRILANKIAVWFGLISFPLYLWHYPLLSFARIIENHTPDLNVRIAALAASVALAFCTYRLVERPLRFGKHETAKVTLLVVVMAIIGYVGYNTYERNGLPFRTVAKENNVFDYSAHWDGWERCDIVPNTPKNGGCRIINKDAPIDLVVIGDSHAGHLASGMRSVFSGTNTNITVMLYAGCFPSYPVNIRGKNYFNCPDNLIGQALDYSIKTKSVETIVLSGYAELKIHQNRFHETQTLSPNELSENLNAFKHGLDKTLRTLSATGKKIVFVVDNPELIRDPKECVVRLGSSKCDLRVGRNVYLERSALYLEAIDALKKKYPSVYFTNTVDFFCDTDYCYGNSGDNLYYATRDHLTPFGSIKFVEFFKQFFK